MTKISNKIIIGALISVTIGIVCIACNTVTNKAIATQPDSSQLSSTIESSSETVSLSESSVLSSDIISSKVESVNSKIGLSSVTKSGTSKKQSVSSSAPLQRKAIQMSETLSSNINDSSTTPSENSSNVGVSTTTKHLQYGVVNPETGAYVPTSDPNYEKYKTELGGDAGTVPDDKSTACQAVMDKIIAKNEADMASSTVSSPN